MRGKRGVSQIDWVISLAFFVIFVMFFFMFLGSRINQPLASNTLINDAETAFLNNVSWTVEKTPVFIDFTQQRPIVADFYLDESKYYYFEGKCFSIDDSKFFYFASDDKVHYLVASGESYPLCNENLSLAHNSNEATTDDAGFEFVNSLLNRASYNSYFRVLDSDYLGNFSNNTYYGDNMIAKYITSSAILQHKSYVVADGSEMLAFIEPYFSAGPINDFSFSLTLDNYISYYIYNNVVNQGNVSGCSSFSNVTFMDFYTPSEGIAFIFDSANIDFCSNGNISLDISLDNFDSASYRIFFHDGDYNDAIDEAEGSDSWFGLTEELRGISESRLNALENVSYDDLKSNFNYPISRNVAYEVHDINDTLIFEYDKSQKDPSGNVFVQRKKANLLDKFGDQRGVEVYSRVW